MRYFYRLLSVTLLVWLSVAQYGHANTFSYADDNEPNVEVQTIDLTPRFLNFYDTALAEEADADQRWKLWQEHYNFAALPPVPEWELLARELLDEAWSQYPDVIDRIRSGVSEMEPAPEPILNAVAELLEYEDPITFNLIVYVGALEQNAYFFVDQQGVPTVAIPIEEEPDWRTLTLAHEFTHLIHAQTAELDISWERTTAVTIFTEGLAKHSERKLFPDLKASNFKDEKDWLNEADGNRQDILQGILPYLKVDDSETVMRFTMGEGTTGVEREAYYVGDLVIGHLIEKGYSVSELARIPEPEIQERVEGVIHELLSD